MLRLTFSYFAWHNTRGIADFFEVAGNILWFIYHLFSIPVLSRTLLSPWRREGEAYRGGFDIRGLFETLVVNTMMRIVGFIVRLAVIIFGLVLLALALAIEIVLFIVWLVLPLAIPVIIISGIRLFLK